MDGNYKNESDIFLDSWLLDREIKYKRRKRKIWSLSVEIVYEGKVIDIIKYYKKKKKKYKKKYKKYYGDNVLCFLVVIIIDSDSDKDFEIKEDIECDNSGF